jgi:DNA-directed RNA polymerase
LFYKPLFLDWRGRVYTKNLTLNYLGSEFMTSLIEFYHSQPLTSDGFKWLKGHGANCFGLDKISFDKRIEWTDFYNLDMKPSFIMDADSPLKFAAFCLAYRTYIKDPSSLIGLPVFLDATCSGLQHISAILRDEILGHQVNLTGTERRDLFSETIEPITKALSVHENPKFHTIKLSRSIIKKPIMTIPYSITTVGITHQLTELFPKMSGEY